MKPLNITVHHIQGATVGYLLGIGVMATIAIKDMNRTRKQAQRVMAFNQRTLKDVWVYLPADLKDKLSDETDFYNIALLEDL